MTDIIDLEEEIHKEGIIVEDHTRLPERRPLLEEFTITPEKYFRLRRIVSKFFPLTSGIKIDDILCHYLEKTIAYSDKKEQRYVN